MNQVPVNVQNGGKTFSLMDDMVVPDFLVKRFWGRMGGGRHETYSYLTLILLQGLFLCHSDPLKFQVKAQRLVYTRGHSLFRYTEISQTDELWSGCIKSNILNLQA